MSCACGSTVEIWKGQCLACRNASTQGRRSASSPQERGRRIEVNAAESRGSRPTPGSGNSPGRPGDFPDGEFLVEHKHTTNASFSVTLALWEKIRGEAYRQGKDPKMVLDIQGTILEVVER